MKLTDSEIIDLLLKFNPTLSKKNAELFASISSYRVFKAKELILKKDRQDRKLFFILKGAARSFKTVEGVELNCHLRAEGFIMGDANSFSPDPTALLDTMSITECHVLLFEIDDLEHLAFNFKEIMEFYLKILKEVITVFSHRIDTFVSMNSKERYQDLMDWNPTYLESTYDKHLASFLGMTPITFHRIKNK
ncbi:MAG: hypothetical protein AAGH46_02280 [Bacteroidota bacterium]